MSRITRVVAFNLLIVALLLAGCRSTPGLPKPAPAAATGTAAAAETAQPEATGITAVGTSNNADAATAAASNQAATTTQTGAQAPTEEAPAIQAGAGTAVAPEAGTTPTVTLSSRIAFPIFGRRSPLSQAQPQAQAQGQTQAQAGPVNAPSGCEGYDVAMQIAASTTQVKVGQTVTFRITLKNQGCSSLSRQQYQLSIGSLGTAGFDPADPIPVGDNKALQPGQSRETVFTLRAAHAGRVAVVGSSNFEVELGAQEPPYWGVVSTTPVNITITR